MNMKKNVRRNFFIRFRFIQSQSTYKWNVSLYLGDQLFDFDLVACFRFLSCRCGPIKLISTNGRNIPEAITHFKSLAATTVKHRIQWLKTKFNYGIQWIHLPFTVTLCSPVPGCVNRSICTEISPTLSSGFCESNCRNWEKVINNC